MKRIPKIEHGMILPLQDLYTVLVQALDTFIISVILISVHCSQHIYHVLFFYFL